MLLSKQIEQLASDVQNEARQRPYIRALIPDLVENGNFWQVVLEVLEIVLHRRGYLIVSRSVVESGIRVPAAEEIKTEEINSKGETK